MRLFNRKKRKRLDLEDMIWAIKMLMMSDKEVKRMINNVRNAVLALNKE